MPGRARGLTVGERLHGAYANLAMAHAAVASGASRYLPKHYAIRNRLYCGLQKGSMQVGSLVEDERLKMVFPQACCYCGATTFLTGDHLIPRKRGGADRGDNLVWACRSCNSSKGGTDVLVWLTRQNRFPPLLLLRRYLKLAIEISLLAGIMDVPAEETTDLPFALDAIPATYPSPCKLTLWWQNSASAATLSSP